MTIRIVTYETSLENELFQLVEDEGNGWIYWEPEHRPAYVEALAKSATYLAFDGEELIGYVRTLDDFLIWIVDLLVARGHRGQGVGSALMRHVADQRPDQDVYVLGADDALGFYEKCGSKSEGIVFQVASRDD